MTQETEVTNQLKWLASFFAGKPALIALVAVAALAFVGLIVAIIACSLHKKKRGAQSISNGKWKISSYFLNYILKTTTKQAVNGHAP